MTNQNKEECVFCNIDLPLPKDNKDLFQWHLDGHGESKNPIIQDWKEEFVSKYRKEQASIGYLIDELLEFIEKVRNEAYKQGYDLAREEIETSYDLYPQSSAEELLKMVGIKK